jgi:two-component system, chemotaxis family, protein-glutamate methylesterase/glutaminase
MSVNFESHRIRVLIVDDSAFMRSALSRMITSEADLVVAGTASCASEALEKIVSLDPDVVTLDVAMPGLDGLGTLRCIMQQFPRPVIMVSAATEKDAETTFAALSAGAFDYIPKQLSPTSLEITHIRSDLVAKIHAAAQSRMVHLNAGPFRKPPTPAPLENRELLSVSPAIVVFGVSTGGPKALEQILPRFPGNFALPILIVQHMPVGFTAPFAQRLNTLCSIAVHEATQREVIQPGIAYIAPAGLHMRVVNRVSDSKTILTLDRHPEDSLHVPSVDILMNSVAEVFKNRALGVIMTGMGSDGATGMSAIYRQGGITIGQDEATCAVYGMPRVCAERGILTRIVPLEDIPAQILHFTRRRRRA